MSTVPTRRRVVAVNIGAPELLIVLAVVLLLFGSKKLPDLARGMGQAAREFNKGVEGHDEEASADTGEDTPTPPSYAA
jgi:sec-independent protein translocase protein TatA